MNAPIIAPERITLDDSAPEAAADDLPSTKPRINSRQSTSTPSVSESNEIQSRNIWNWLFSDSFSASQSRDEEDSYDWARVIPFVLLHVACFGVIWVGVSSAAVITAIGLYLFRMFAITAFYHRYFSHRSFRTSRPFQFVMACMACTAGQRGPLWWAGHHRWHHKHSDEDQDLHSPSLLGFVRSHMGWFLTKSAFSTPKKLVGDWYRYPELRLINRLDWVPLVLLGVATFLFGSFLASYYPSLGTNGPQMLVWGFFISTVVLYHATYTINSLAHRFGHRRFKTSDDSRNNFALAILTLGEGWHNNHHHYPASARQGFYWWEIDITYYVLKAMSWTGLIWSLKPVSERALHRNLVKGNLVKGNHAEENLAANSPDSHSKGHTR